MVLQNDHDDSGGRALTLEGLCARLQIDPSTYHRHREHMPTPIRIGKALRFPLTAVEDWEHEQVKRERRRQRSAR